MPALDMGGSKGSFRHAAASFDLKTGETNNLDPNGAVVPAFSSPGQAYLNMVPAITHYAKGNEKEKAGKQFFDTGIQAVLDWEQDILGTDTWQEVVNLYMERREDVRTFCAEMVKQWTAKCKTSKKKGAVPPPQPHLNLTVGGVPIGEHPVYQKFHNHQSSKARKGRKIVDPLLGVEGIAPEKSPIGAAIGIKLGPNLSHTHENGECWGYTQNEQMPLTAEGVIHATEFFDSLDKVWFGDLCLMSWTDEGEADRDFNSIFQCRSEDELMKMVALLRAPRKLSKIGRGAAKGNSHILLFRKQNVRMKILAYETVPESALRDNLVKSCVRFKGYPLWVLMKATLSARGSKRELTTRCLTRWMQRMIYATGITETEFNFVQRDYLSYLIRGLDRDYVRKAQELIMEDYVKENGPKDPENHLAYLAGKALATACNIAYHVDGSNRSDAMEKKFLKRLIQHPEHLGDLDEAVNHIGKSARARAKGVTPKLKFYDALTAAIHERTKVEGVLSGRLTGINKTLFMRGFSVTNHLIREKAAENRAEKEAKKNSATPKEHKTNSDTLTALGMTAEG